MKQKFSLVLCALCCSNRYCANAEPGLGKDSERHIGRSFESGLNVFRVAGASSTCGAIFAGRPQPTLRTGAACAKTDKFGPRTSPVTDFGDMAFRFIALVKIVYTHNDVVAL